MGARACCTCVRTRARARARARARVRVRARACGSQYAFLGSTSLSCVEGASIRMRSNSTEMLSSSPRGLAFQCDARTRSSVGAESASVALMPSESRLRPK
eukprot:2730493-Pleurochrysis_carterae.AAC.1